MIKIGIDYYPEQWDRALWEEDTVRMRALGAHVIRIGEFAWSRMEPKDGEFDFAWLDDAIETISRQGMQVILGTPTNCVPLWLYQNHPDTVQWGRDGKPTDLGLRGHRCMVSPTFRQYAGRIVEEMAKRYAGRPEIFAWQLDNELESNHCTCPACRAAFREWLREKYGTLEALNRAWGNVVWSGEVSDWEQIQPLLSPDCLPRWHNPAYLLDYERFGADCTADFVRFQSEIIRRYNANAVITTNACIPANIPDFHKEFALKNQTQSDGFAYWTQLRLFHEACIGLGVNVDVIHEDAALDGYQVVLVPTHFVTNPGLASRLEDFARSGGTVVITNRSGVQDKNGNCILGQELPTVFRNLCGCHVTEYDPIGPVKQTVNLTKGGTYQITSWCDLLELDTAQAWARYQGRFYSGVPAIAKNCFGEGVAYYVGTVGEKAMYRTLLMEAFREQNIPLLETLPQGVESTTRSGDGGTYQFFFNNTLHGQNFQLQGERVHLRPLEMKIRTEKAVWV